MAHAVMKMVDVEVTVSLAVDSSMTWDEIKAWVAQAIEAKIDTERELTDWGGGMTRVDPNGPYVTEAHIAGAL